jgi:putative zinc finger/helix-turn-helix YgiT family protein
MIRCSNCDTGSMTEGHVKDYDASSVVGLASVTLGRARALICDQCGHVMFPGDVVEAITRELAKLVIRQGEELRPDEVRFLRELIGMTQAELGARMGLSRATVNRWETGDDDVGAVQSLAVRTLAAWALDDAGLAREVGAPRRQPEVRSAPPYQIGASSR